MVGSMKSLTLEPAGEERSQIVRQPPSFLGLRRAWSSGYWARVVYHRGLPGAQLGTPLEERL